jgi:hypothetical protein
MSADENRLVVNLVHAMLCSVTSNLRAVFLHQVKEAISLTFVLAEESDQDRQEIDEIVFELQALEPDLVIAVSISVSGTPIENLPSLGRLIFARKE